VSLIEFNVLGKDNILIDVPDDFNVKEKRKFIRKSFTKTFRKKPNTPKVSS
jgi:hypothetical protein